MATCKDCLHIGICPNLNHETVADKCPDFKDRSRFVELPCKVGDAVYETDGIRIYPHQIKKLIFDVGHIAFDESAIGTSIFLTREEAEAELARITANG